MADRNDPIRVTLQPASEDQVEQICSLINLAYRGEQGWTRETDLIAGNRTSTKEVQAFLQDDKSHLLVLTEGAAVKACICVEDKNTSAYIGYFAVHPELQGQGLGKVILQQAEHYATAHLGKNKFVMLVVSQREELIRYYERQGYVRTGKTREFPVHLDVGVPRVQGLSIEFLKKTV